MMGRTVTADSDSEIADLFLGADPGKSGAFSLVHRNGGWVDCMRMTETPADIGKWVRKYRRRICFGILEEVGAMPTDARSSAFKFGTSYGMMWGMLVVCKIRFEKRRPASWQTQMGCRTKGDKNISKAAAQNLFPAVKVVHANADSLLLAELARRVGLERGW
jgi:hypothetical protein